jgi:hypothetical protein
MEAASGHIFLEDIHHPGSGKGDAIFTDVTEGIVSVWLGRIGSVEIDHLIPVRRRNACSDACDKIAVRINESEAIAALQVLKRHSFDQRRLASTLFPMT